MSDVGQPSITSWYERVRKRLLWCRARSTGEYNERHVRTILDGIEAELNRIVNSNPSRDPHTAVERLKHLNDQLVALDHQVIDPTIRRFSPLLRAWTEEFDAQVQIVQQQPSDSVPIEVRHAVEQLEHLLDLSSSESSERSFTLPEQVPALLER